MFTSSSCSGELSRHMLHIRFMPCELKFFSQQLPLLGVYSRERWISRAKWPKGQRIMEPIGMAQQSDCSIPRTACREWSVPCANLLGVERSTGITGEHWGHTSLSWQVEIWIWKALQWQVIFLLLLKRPLYSIVWARLKKWISRRKKPRYGQVLTAAEVRLWKAQEWGCDWDSKIIILNDD